MKKFADDNPDLPSNFRSGIVPVKFGQNGPGQEVKNSMIQGDSINVTYQMGMEDEK